MKKTYLKCIKGVVVYHDEKEKLGDILSLKNELWGINSTDEKYYELECIHGLNQGKVVIFTLQQVADCFEFASSSVLS